MAKKSSRPARPGATAKPFSIRLTEDERRHLAAQAGKTPLATYLRDLVLEKPIQTGRKRQIGKIEDHAAFARVLAGLGQTGLAQSLQQLAAAASIGALVVSSEVEGEITSACRAVRAIRRDLMLALGLKDHAGAP
jgi:hypothetical protein